LMAMVPSLAKGVFKAESGPHRILVDRQRSRVYAQSEAELRAAQNDLMLSNWDFIPALPTAAVTNDYQYSIALDAFCIVAALQNVGRFPDLPDNRYQLSDWPDIGVAGDVPHIFSLIRLLQKAPLTTSDAIAKSGMDAQEAAALLWALKASGVLKEARETSPAPAKPRPQKTLPEPGFLNKLMARFGLVASSRGA
ncbi:MAG: hypothetical protein Q8J78_01700, partial [Moraxellaceae bacterium]|nr:hypothetical protein [Moraxellaceae bacterium]